MRLFTNGIFKNVTLPKLKITASHGVEPIKTPDLPLSVIVASLISIILGLALPLTILQVYDRILPNKSTDTLLVLALGLVCVLVLDAVLKILRSFIVSWLSASFSHKAHLEAMRRILYARSDLRSKLSVSKQIEQLKALQSLADHYGSPARLLIIDLPASLVFVAILFLIGGPVGFVPIVLLGIFALRTASLNEKLHRMVGERTTQDQRKYDFLLEVLAGLDTIKSMALEPVIMRRFERLQRSYSELGYDYIELSNRARDASTVFTSLTTVGVVSVGAFMVISGSMSIGAVAACTLLAGQAVQPLLRGINHWTDMQRINHDYQEACNLFSLPTEDALPTEQIPVQGRVSIQHLEYFNKSGSTVHIRDLELTIKAGESIAVAGADGSGRSLLLRLISGDLKPTSGHVLIDDHDLFGPAHQALRRQISYVGNDAQVFTGTILQNLTLFGVQADPAKARLAADLIGLEKDIHLLPQGYDTMLGGGLDENLTTSFIQRIAIARAIAGEPRILLLDDANGALDMPSETALIKALERIKGQMTLILVSHRPSFRAIADRQIIMDAGKITEVSATPTNPAQAGQNKPVHPAHFQTALPANSVA
ncbi:ATP-binding cassette domain-containing protein [Roseibium sp. CAU 1637]|uniref:ATP-binding cassette domain-containing protein n=1 Tax=Roseibium limicola TaxID=2816037 RepID=A0A939EQI7_9HYPH|nr:ABC transporter transmembrane domain-containing protein [Roseibium limicola]MBO0346829.1 ATP-binding cassette domain-containing protein [Roseibium limicola]